MDESTRARIFDPFFTTKGPDKGTGLGLYVVYSLMKHIGGSIQVTSHPGAGTAFTLLFPTCREAASPAPLVGEREPAAGAALRILVVDDEEEIRQLLKVSLESAGYAVTLAASGEEALERFAATPDAHYDLVVIDLKMPGMGGWATIRRIRESRLRLPIMVLTGSLDPLPPQPGDVQRLGVQILSKPVQMVGLRNLIQTVTAAARDPTSTWPR